MKTDNNFVRSGEPRLKNDNYQTIDTRCIYALIETLSINKDLQIADCCSPNGSGILSEMSKLGYDTYSIEDAFSNFQCGWNIFNPPYKRNIVDKIIIKQLYNLSARNTTDGIAVLLRTGFDHAKTRVNMFDGNLAYAGQIKMLFRPIWFVDTTTTPIHNYVWHIWLADNLGKPPRVWYW